MARHRAIGDRFIYSGQARMLELIAESKGEVFYEGELAEAIVGPRATGGWITLANLAAHRAAWVEPIGMK